MQDIMLKDLLDWPNILKAGRYAGGHTEVMDALFTNSIVLAAHVEAEYEGTLGYVYLVWSENHWAKVVVITDYFGSCSGCDAWEDADDNDVRELCTALANNAHMFDSIDEATEFLANAINDPAIYYGLRNVAGPLIIELGKAKENATFE